MMPAPPLSFDPTQPVRQRNGLPARILATDLNGRYPIIAVLIRDDGSKYPCMFTTTGRSFNLGGEGLFDLVNIDPPAPGFDSVEWLRKMIRHSDLTDCKPEFELIASEIERLRAELLEARALFPRSAPIVLDREWAHKHAVELEQCSIFAADVGPSIAKAMTDAAAFLRALHGSLTRGHFKAAHQAYAALQGDEGACAALVRDLSEHRT